MSSLPDRVKVGNVVLRRVPEGKAPEHYLWKKALEREWAGEWGTLARLTNYRYKIGLDPSFVEERPEFKRGRLHWYEWILCENGGFVGLYNDKDRIGQIWTTPLMGEKTLGGVAGAKLYLTSDERLAQVIHFPLDKIMEICELAGARKARKGRVMTAEEIERSRDRMIKYHEGRAKKAPGMSVSGQVKA